MTALRLSGMRALTEELLLPGDTVLGSESFQPLVTIGAGSVLASLMLSGVLYRTGPTGAYTDTYDTPENIITALAGNLFAGAVVAGLSFKLRVVNSVAFIQTITLPSGIVAGSGVVATIPASSWRDLLFTFTNVQQPVSNAANTTNGSAVVTWAMNPGQLVEYMGPSPFALNIQPGCTVKGTGVPTNTTVLSVQQGQGGTTGITMSANATATGLSALSFNPTMKVDSSGSGTL